MSVGSSIGSLGKRLLQKVFHNFKGLTTGHSDINIHDVHVEEKKDSNEILRSKFQEAYEFYKRYTLHIDILRDNVLYETYFPKLPRCDYLTEEMKIKFNTEVDRSTINSKV
jgi:hypothetical protein